MAILVSAVYLDIPAFQVSAVSADIQDLVCLAILDTVAFLAYQVTVVRSVQQVLQVSVATLASVDTVAQQVQLELLVFLVTQAFLDIPGQQAHKEHLGSADIQVSVGTLAFLDTADGLAFLDILEQTVHLAFQVSVAILE